MDRGAQPEPVLLAGTSTSADWVRMARAVKWDPAGLPSPRLVREACAVASYLSREKPDCVLPNLARAATATATRTRLFGEPDAGRAGGARAPGLIPRRVRQRWRHLSPHAVHFVGVSEGVSESVVETVGVPFEKVTTVYNPVVPPTCMRE